MIFCLWQSDIELYKLSDIAPLREAVIGTARNAGNIIAAQLQFHLLQQISLSAQQKISLKNITFALQ